MARGKRAAGNADGTPREELADADPLVEAVVAAFKAEEAKASTEAEGDENGPEFLQEAARREAQDGTSVRSLENGYAAIEAEEAEEADRPQTTYWSKKKAAAQAKENATYILVILEGAAMVGFGETARMSASEKKMIIEPMSRIMGRLDPGINDALQKWTDPILLVFGFATWGLRLYAIAQEKNEGDEPPSKRPPSDVKPMGPGGNGRVIKEPVPEFSDADRVTMAGPDKRLLDQIDPSARSLS